MELSSAPLHKGQLPWRGLLLAASLLIYWSSPTTAQVTVEAVPPHVAEGANVLLSVYNLPETPQVFYWHKGENPDNSNEITRFITSANVTTTGPAYSGRETIYPNGSLLFQNVTQKDTGAYMLQMLMQSYDTMKLSVQFHVQPRLPKPSIISDNYIPMEGEDSVTLRCEPETENTSYLWSRNGQSLSEGDRLKLSEGNRTLTLLSVVRNDTGAYECETRKPVSTSRSDPFTLNIIYGPDIPIISPSNTYFRSRTNLSLSCHSAAYPPALYAWFVNGELVSSSQELFIPNITTDDSGTYTCFVYKSITRLNRTTVKNIKVLEPVTTPSIRATKSEVKERDSVHLTCDFNSSDSTIAFRWFHNGKGMEFTDRVFLIQGRILSIAHARKEDSGVYQCEIYNALSSKRSDPFQLNIRPFVVIYWSSSTMPEITVEAVPPHVDKGKSVVLLVHDMPEKVHTFFWYKGEHMVEKNEIARFLKSNRSIKTGPAYSGREKIYENGSLVFQNVTKNDEGTYRLHIITANFDISELVHVHVNPK
ncbi:carcinoembryonic antigen-related cell adhesion molecule 8-like [Microtus ochrogaster]|uniref:Carcinoembryonic antigen-related cell adhesion molecule 8-like n=1 Tax=Microtus ochrogaster TaxID=79684 RepID=A0ABM1AZ82_MICOH|nr:carcinoembryonic antigen-related cell adhesion molecule 8-like [Microtus ochrogaster]